MQTFACPYTINFIAKNFQYYTCKNIERQDPDLAFSYWNSFGIKTNFLKNLFMEVENFKILTGRQKNSYRWLPLKMLVIFQKALVQCTAGFEKNCLYF